MTSFAHLSRRGFLGMASAAGIAASLSLSGCGTSSSASSGASAKLSGSSMALMPTSAPSNWDKVLAQFNDGLKKEHGITLDAQFINWTNYGQQALLKFTAGAKFDTALQAIWLNMAQLQQDKALTDLTSEISKWPNLSKTLDDQLLSSNKWSGHLWGVPQVNSAGRIQHFTIRKDLADKYGLSEINDFDTLDKYFYDVKQKESGVTPFGVASNQTWELAVPTPTGLFNTTSWEDPSTIEFLFAGSGLQFLFAKDAATTGSSNPIPFWEDAGVIDAFRRLRKYYQDGIINANGLNVDNATVTAQFGAGKFGGQWAITDGTASSALVNLKKAVPTADLMQVLPFGKPYTQVKPHQTFQADNLVVVNANGGDINRALAIQDYVSIQDNHDLLAYGIKGTDWEPVGDDGVKQLSDYSFPGYALLWRAKLERRSSYMTDSEKQVFDWAQSYDNFTKDIFASFIPDATSVKQAAASMSNVITQYAYPLFYGMVDVDDQLGKLKSAADNAGLSKLQAAMESQANAYLKQNASSK